MRCLQRRKKTPHPSAFGCHLLPQEKAFFILRKQIKAPHKAGRGLECIFTDTIFNQTVFNIIDNQFRVASNVLLEVIGIPFGLSNSINRFIPPHKNKSSVCIDIVFGNISPLFYATISFPLCFAAFSRALIFILNAVLLETPSSSAHLSIVCPFM